MKIETASFSKLETYEWCQWKFFLQYLLGFQDPSGSAALLGNIGHTVLEILAKACMVKHPENSKIWNINWLMEKSFNHYFKKFPEIASEIPNDKLKKVSNGILDFLNSKYSPIGKDIIGTELRFGINLEKPEFLIKKKPDGNPQYLYLNGFIDRIDKINKDTIEIFDYKTGTRTNYKSKDRGKITARDLYEMLQPRMYHLAAKNHFPWAKNILVTYVYITDGGPVTTPFSDEDIVTTQSLIAQRFRAIRANENPSRIYPSWKCNMCPHNEKKTNNCHKIWAEKNELGMQFIENKYTVLNNRKK